MGVIEDYWDSGLVTEDDETRIQDSLDYLTEELNGWLKSHYPGYKLHGDVGAHLGSMNGVEYDERLDVSVWESPSGTTLYDGRPLANPNSFGADAIATADLPYDNIREALRSEGYHYGKGTHRSKKGRR